MDLTSGLYNNNTKSSSPPDTLSNSSNTSQSKTKLTDSVSHLATSGPTLQGRSSYATIRKTISNERLDSADSASAGTTSSRPSRTREARLADDESNAVPAAVSRGRQAATHRGDISKFDVEVNAQSRAGQVSVALLPLVISPTTLGYSLPPTQTTREALFRITHLLLSPLTYLLRKKPEQHNVRV